jgi:hypothetical protein
VPLSIKIPYRRKEKNKHRNKHEEKKEIVKMGEDKY